MQNTMQRTNNKGKAMQTHAEKDKPMQRDVTWHRKECGPMQTHAKIANNGNTKHINAKQGKAHRCKQRHRTVKTYK